jgi:hypothetical protein
VHTLYADRICCLVIVCYLADNLIGTSSSARKSTCTCRDHLPSDPQRIGRFNFCYSQTRLGAKVCRFSKQARRHCWCARVQRDRDKVGRLHGVQFVPKLFPHALLVECKKCRSEAHESDIAEMQVVALELAVVKYRIWHHGAMIPVAASVGGAAVGMFGAALLPES